MKYNLRTILKFLKHQHKAPKHSNSKPYVCEICTKSFSRVSILINHKKTHEDKKRFQCKVCEKAFHHKISLKTHMNIHTKERSYICSTCTKKFNQKLNLAVHQKTCYKESAPADKAPQDQAPRNQVTANQFPEDQASESTQSLDNKPGTRMGEKEPPAFKTPHPYDPSETSTDDRRKVNNL